MRTHHGATAASGQSGFSLVEGLIASALLLLIAVSILPLFSRAIESNVSGGRSSQLSTFVSVDIERVNQLLVDRDDWEIAAEPGGVKDLGTRYWDIGPLYGVAGIPDKLGDERWVADPTTAQGPVMWSSTSNVRKYSLADLEIYIGTDIAEDEIVSVGNPMLLDQPLTEDENAQLTEIRVSVKENRAALPAGSGQRITISHFRAF